MLKWLLLIGVVLGFLWWIGRGRRPGPQRRDVPPPADPAPAPAPRAAAPEPMISCAHCGVWLPRSDAVSQTGTSDLYCSAEHRDAGRPSRP